MYNKTKFVLMLTGGLLGSWSALAQECVVAPSCADLGYTQSASDCPTTNALYCPFDRTKVYCGSVSSCSALGFTDVVASCPGTYSICPEDPSLGKCDFEGSAGDLKFSLRTADHNGWLLCNGRSYSSAEYPELYAVLKNSFGTKLPNYADYFLKGAATSSASTFKTAEQAGLPNISASLSGGTSRLDAFLGDSLSASGAFSLSGTNSKEAIPQGGGSWGAQSLSFSASKSNSIYGRSTTVTPQNYKANIFIYAGRTSSADAPNTAEQCEELGYKLIKGSVTGNVLTGLLCLTTQTIEYCPYNNEYGKCVDNPENDCLALGYSKPLCMVGQTKEYCPLDNSFYKCVGSGSSAEICLGGYLLSEIQGKCPQYGFKVTGQVTNQGPCYRCCTAAEQNTCINNSTALGGNGGFNSSLLQ